MPQFQQGHALVIAVSDYKDPGLKLAKPITVADAEGVADALKDPAVAAYPSGQVYLIPKDGGRATKEAMVKAFEQFSGRVASSDTAFIFFCGHGVLGEDGEYYLTTEDTVLTAKGRVKGGTGLAKTKLLDLLRAVKARKVLFIINACFSGHVGGTLSAREGVPGSTAVVHTGCRDSGYWRRAGPDHREPPDPVFLLHQPGRQHLFRPGADRRLAGQGGRTRGVRGPL